jgi:hypothetical protein
MQSLPAQVASCFRQQKPFVVVAAAVLHDNAAHEACSQGKLLCGGSKPFCGSGQNAVLVCSFVGTPSEAPWGAIWV